MTSSPAPDAIARPQQPPQTLLQTAARLLAYPAGQSPLYHYTSREAYLGILSSGAVWATAIQYLGDSREYQMGLDLIRREIGARVIQDPTLQELLLQIVDGSGWSYPRAFVASFSALRDDLSQWRAYGGGSGGIALGFECQRLVQQVNISAGVLVPVHYASPHAPAGTVPLVAELCTELVDKARLAQHSPEAVQALRARIDLSVQFVCSILKDVAFAAEREWRAIIFGPFPPRVTLEVRQGRSQLIPTCVTSIRDGDRPDSLGLAEVLLGPTPHVETALTSTKLALVLRNQPSCPVNPSDVPFRDW
jgi:hypothetical protein